jgi:hypothetical protein
MKANQLDGIGIRKTLTARAVDESEREMVSGMGTVY